MSHRIFYLLNDDHTIRLTDDLLEWGDMFESSKRIVCTTEIGESRISTVFLGLDHSFTTDGPPLLFETLVFDGPLDGEMERYTTWDEAVNGHAVMVNKVLATCREP